MPRLKNEIDAFTSDMRTTANLPKNSDKGDPMKLDWEALIDKFIEEVEEILIAASGARFGRPEDCESVFREAADVGLTAMFLKMKAEQEIIRQKLP